jgi:hypothetical protein
MKLKYREKTEGGFLCTKYGCEFNNADFCKKRAENNIDEICQACTGIAALEKVKGSKKLEFSTRSMNRKRAA